MAQRFLAVLGALLLGAPLARAEEPAPSPEERALQRAEAVERALVKVVGDVRPCSLSVLVYGEEKGRESLHGCGSGVVVKSSGLALTNEHVTRDASRLEVVFPDGKRLPATVEQRIPQFDIVLLQIRDEKGKPKEGLQAASLGGSESLKEGQWVFATGNPFFLAATGQPVVTLGVLSGFNRVTQGEFLYGKAIQHDAEVNPGNSGGPLWDAKGRLLGINGQIMSRSRGIGPSNSGVALTIPIDQIQKFLKGVLVSGDRKSKKAGDLGLKVETAKDEKGQELGAEVQSIRPGSPASEPSPKGERILPGDIIESVVIRGKTYPVRTATEYVNLVASWPSGTALESVVVRRRFWSSPADSTPLPIKGDWKRWSSVLHLGHLKLGPMPEMEGEK